MGNIKKAFLATKQRKLCVRLTPEPDNTYDTHAVALCQRWMCV